MLVKTSSFWMRVPRWMAWPSGQYDYCTTKNRRDLNFFSSIFLLCVSSLSLCISQRFLLCLVTPPLKIYLSIRLSVFYSALSPLPSNIWSILSPLPTIPGWTHSRCDGWVGGHAQGQRTQVGVAFQDCLPHQTLLVAGRSILVAGRPQHVCTLACFFLSFFFFFFFFFFVLIIIYLIFFSSKCFENASTTVGVRNCCVKNINFTWASRH